MSIRQAILDMLDKTITTNDYMTLVVTQMKIKNNFYASLPEDKIKNEIRALLNYKKSYPHISKELDDIVDYIEVNYLSKSMNDAEELSDAN